MGRRVEIVVLCEDEQHEAFVRRFLRYTLHASIRKIHVLRGAPGTESMEAYVRRELPRWLTAVRKRHVASALIVITDGDTQDRRPKLRKACIEAGVPWPSAEEPVLVVIPNREIETWLEYLNGRTVNEAKQYPQLDKPRQCKLHVQALIAMCDAGESRKPWPPSLNQACIDYAAFRQAVKA